MTLTDLTLMLGIRQSAPSYCIALRQELVESVAAVGVHFVGLAMFDGTDVDAQQGFLTTTL